MVYPAILSNQEAYTDEEMSTKYLVVILAVTVAVLAITVVVNIVIARLMENKQMTLLEQLAAKLTKLVSTSQAEHSVVSLILQHVKAQGLQFAEMQTTVTGLEGTVANLNKQLADAGLNTIDPVVIKNMSDQIDTLTTDNQADEDALTGLFPATAPPVVVVPDPSPAPPAPAPVSAPAPVPVPVDPTPPDKVPAHEPFPEEPSTGTGPGSSFGGSSSGS